RSAGVTYYHVVIACLRWLDIVQCESCCSFTAEVYSFFTPLVAQRGSATGSYSQCNIVSLIRCLARRTSNNQRGLNQTQHEVEPAIGRLNREPGVTERIAERRRVQIESRGIKACNSG